VILFLFLTFSLLLPAAHLFPATTTHTRDHHCCTALPASHLSCTGLLLHRFCTPAHLLPALHSFWILDYLTTPGFSHHHLPTHHHTFLVLPHLLVYTHHTSALFPPPPHTALLGSTTLFTLTSRITATHSLWPLPHFSLCVSSAALSLPLSPPPGPCLTFPYCPSSSVGFPCTWVFTLPCTPLPGSACTTLPPLTPRPHYHVLHHRSHTTPTPAPTTTLPHCTNSTFTFHVFTPWDFTPHHSHSFPWEVIPPPTGSCTFHVSLGGRFIQAGPLTPGTIPHTCTGLSAHLLPALHLPTLPPSHLPHTPAPTLPPPSTAPGSPSHLPALHCHLHTLHHCTLHLPTLDSHTVPATLPWVSLGFGGEEITPAPPPPATPPGLDFPLSFFPPLRLVFYT